MDNKAIIDNRVFECENFYHFENNLGTTANEINIVRVDDIFHLILENTVAEDVIIESTLDIDELSIAKGCFIKNLMIKRNMHTIRIHKNGVVKNVHTKFMINNLLTDSETVPNVNDTSYVKLFQIYY